LLSSRRARPGALVAAFIAALGATPAAAEAPSAELREAPPRALAWPVTIALSVMAGVEVQGERGAPPAFGASGELLWRGRVGGFVGLLSSSGTSLLPARKDGANLPSLADRLSVPLALAVRPLFPLAERLGGGYGARLLHGIDLQVGLTIENLRTSEESRTVAGLHAGLGIEVPLWGGPLTGGVALRAWGRLLVTPEVRLAEAQTQKVYEGVANGQLLAGLVWRP
jgi:hypothetical protein